MKTEIKLGQKVKDVVTGYTGIAVSKCEFLNGCVQFGVTPEWASGKDFPDTNYLDYKRLEVVESGVSVETEDTGGEMADAPR